MNREIEQFIRRVKPTDFMYYKDNVLFSKKYSIVDAFMYKTCESEYYKLWKTTLDKCIKKISGVFTHAKHIYYNCKLNDMNGIIVPNYEVESINYNLYCIRESLRKIKLIDSSNYESAVKFLIDLCHRRIMTLTYDDEYVVLKDVSKCLTDKDHLCLILSNKIDTNIVYKLLFHRLNIKLNDDITQLLNKVVYDLNTKKVLLMRQSMDDWNRTISCGAVLHSSTCFLELNESIDNQIDEKFIKSLKREIKKIASKELEKCLTSH